MVKAVTGWDVTIDELMTVGERRLNLMRTFNAREGINRNADKLPKKLYKALGGEGPTAGIALTHEEIESALDEYYRLAEWTKDGEPTRVKLEKLDLAWAAELL
jgi:aldehyde:ferredoxin oxidoreductase